MKANGRTKYETEGVGLAYIVTKEVYATPKTVDEKNELFGYIKDHHGEEALTGLLSINHQTLNSFANKEQEASPGIIIPGLGMPTVSETLNFRKK